MNGLLIDNHDNANNSSVGMTFSPDEIGEIRITSYEIAEVCGKLHKVVLKAIRNMEPAWFKVSGHHLVPRLKIRELNNGVKKEDPYYSLTRNEALFVATKFSDEARAKLVLRLDELERQFLFPQTYLQALHAFVRVKEVEQQQRKLLLEQKPKVEYYEDVLSSKSHLTATQIGHDFDKSARWLNKELNERGIIRKTNKTWTLCSKYMDKGYAETYTVAFDGKDNDKYTKTNLVWTEKGREFIHNLLEKEFPLVEEKPETESK